MSKFLQNKWKENPRGSSWGMPTMADSQGQPLPPADQADPANPAELLAAYKNLQNEFKEYKDTNHAELLNQVKSWFR